MQTMTESQSTNFIFLSGKTCRGPTMVCHLVAVVALMHRWPGRFLIWRRGANQAQTAW